MKMKYFMENQRKINVTVSYTLIELMNNCRLHAAILMTSNLDFELETRITIDNFASLLWKGYEIYFQDDDRKRKLLWINNKCLFGE